MKLENSSRFILDHISLEHFEWESCWRHAKMSYSIFKCSREVSSRILSRKKSRPRKCKKCGFHRRIREKPNIKIHTLNRVSGKKNIRNSAFECVLDYNRIHTTSILWQNMQRHLRTSVVLHTQRVSFDKHMPPYNLYIIYTAHNSQHT